MATFKERLNEQMKTENPMVADLLGAIKVITEDYVKNLPAKELFKVNFHHNPVHFYKVFSKDHCIQVCTLEGYESIGVKDADLATHAPTNGECTDSEFYKEYVKVLKILNDKVFSVEI